MVSTSFVLANFHQSPAGSRHGLRPLLSLAPFRTVLGSFPILAGLDW